MEPHSSDVDFDPLQWFLLNIWSPANDKITYRYNELSPEWLSELHSVSAKYDNLESERRQGKWPSPVRHVWQDDFETWIKQIKDDIKSKQSTTVEEMDKLWDWAPLLARLHRFLGSEIKDKEFSWKMALESWMKFQEVVENDPAFLKSLAPA
ncbi:hypothetical protein DHEL01_v210918 [Diaporthe helianthi]|uniref:Uncharacterized protein n=1 Tax=Diaporthe helianthi TaxID=158607 RepID=A0A2P5HKA2_DIAHE|nr:hypothetical protein DHEL01_v210918 [Diaporthe helianthi]